jgi:thioesterase domain-containing protein
MLLTSDAQLGNVRSSSSLLVPIQPCGTKPPFFFVHSVSSEVVSYRALSRYLGADQPFYCLQARGLDGELPPLRRIEDVAAFYIQEIRTVQPGGPYFLGGASSGGVVAFEMAHQLRAQRQAVGLLALFDTYFPGSRSTSLISRADRFVGILLQRRLRDQVRYLLRTVRFRALRRVRRLIYRIHPESESLVARARRQVLKASIEAVMSYVPQSYPDRIVFFYGRQNPERSFSDGRLNWSAVAGGGLEVHLVPGDHDTFFEEPHVRATAEGLRALLRV